MKFRKATISDIDSIYKIEKSVFSHPWSKKQIIYELDNVSYSSNWVALIDNKVIGFILSHITGTEVQIINIAVKLEYQCRGIGKNILNIFLNQFKEDTFFFLEVKKSNLSAFYMYSHLGFNQIDTRKKYYADGEDAIVMAKYGNLTSEVLQINQLLNF